MAAQQCILFKPSEKWPQRCKEKFMNADEIVSFSAENPNTIHIEFDGSDHYAAMLGSTGASVHTANTITDALLAVTPVSQQTE